MKKINIRKATSNDSLIYFKWVNDPIVRENSFNSEEITLENHLKWFNETITNSDFHFYLFEFTKDKIIGQVRIQKIDKKNYLIGISVSSDFRGKGYGSKIIKMACDDFLLSNPKIFINAYIKEDNFISNIIFEKAGFKFINKINYNNFKCFHYIFYENK